MAEYCQSNSNSYSGVSANNFRGNEINTPNSVIGVDCTGITGYMFTDGAVGTVTGKVYNSSHVLQKTWSSIDASTITDSELPYSFTGSSYTIQSDDIVGFEADLSSGSVDIMIATTTQTGWKRVERDSGVWSTPTDTVALKMCLTDDPAPSSGGTVMPPPYANIGLSGL